MDVFDTGDAPLDVGLVERNAYGDNHIEEILIVRDEHVGDIKFRLYRPVAQEEAVPGVLGLPGHPFTMDEVPEFLEDNHAHEIIDAGLVFLVLETRAYDGDHEQEANAALTCTGMSSLVAARQHEITQGRRVLDYLQSRGVVTDRYGLIGHSGGAQAASLAVRLEEGFSIAIIDNRSVFVELATAETDLDGYHIGDDTHTGCTGVERPIGSGTVAPEDLGLYGRNLQIHDYGRSDLLPGVAVMDIGYNEPYEATGALDFLVEGLYQE